MKNRQTRAVFLITFLAFVLLLGTTAANAQTSQFTYQGRFSDSAVPSPTNGTYAIQFALFDAVAGGNQVGQTISLQSVQVVNGVFTVTLDYGTGAFGSQDVYIELRPFSAQSNTYVTLNPRQKVTSAPFAIQSINAVNAATAGDSARLGGVPSGNFVQTGDPRLSDARSPVGGSPNYIQNGSSPQASSSFNVSNDGTVGGTLSANVVRAATQFNIGANRVLAAGSGNLFAGLNTGTATTTGGDNAFVGTNAGMTNTTGFNNSFFGTDAGRSNTGSSNSFFGRSSGFANTTGGNNAFFGLDAGRFNTTGDQNAFFGVEAGSKNIGGANNTFTGGYAGFNNLSGIDNAFFGLSSGFSNTTGTGNTFAGRNAGQNNSTGNTNSFFGNFAGVTNTIGSNNSALGNSADLSANNLNFATAIGAGSVASASNTINLGRSDGSDTVRVFGLGAAGATSLCRNALNEISTCSASGGSFIQNSTVLQPSSNFNISGAGTVGGLFSANIVNSTTNFRIANTPVLSTPNGTSVVVGQLANHSLIGVNSTFLGYKAGQFSNSFSQANTFIGSESGESNTSGGNNAFVGKDSGFFNTSGSFNSFFGSGAGVSNKTASDNSFFGYQAGVSNTTGTHNSSFGSGAGQSGQTVSDNSFFGYLAGSSTTAGSNSFFGSLAGDNNSSGGSNAFFGSNSGGLNNSGSSNAFYGSDSGAANTTGTENSFFGRNSGGGNAAGNGNSSFGFQTGPLVTNSSFNTIIGYKAGVSNFGSNNTFLGANSNSSPSPLSHSTAIGADSFFTASNTIVLGTTADIVQVPNNIKVNGDLLIGDMFASGNVDVQGNMHLLNLSLGGSQQVCRNASANLAVCSSSLRYKTNIAPYFGGLKVLNKLKPITFDWKEGGMHDVGFGAEDVEKVDPLLVIYNEKGQVEGVKYDRISTALVNAVKEQQAQIEHQQAMIDTMQRQLNELKRQMPKRRNIGRKIGGRK